MDAGSDRVVGGEIRALTGLRAVAAAWVVVHHFWVLAPAAQWAGLLEPIRPLLQVGWLGVDLFFVLSGFVLTYNYVQAMGARPRLGATVSFYWNRLSRVWPLWAFVTVTFTGWLVLKHVTIGGEHLHDGVQPSVGPLPLLEQLLMVQMWTRPLHWGNGAINPGWSLSAEWLAYCAFPVLVLVFHRLTRLPAAVLGIAAVAVLLPYATVVAAGGSHDFAWSWLFRIAGSFVAGALTSLAVRRIAASARNRRLAGVVAGAGVGQLLVVVWWAALSEGDYAGIAVPLFPVLVGALALADTGLARWLSVPWVVLGGRISFALYLVHQCIFEVFWTGMDLLPVLGPHSRWSALAAPAVLVSTVPAAYLLWRFVEEPARLRMRALERRRRPAPVPAPRPVSAPTPNVVTPLLPLPRTTAAPRAATRLVHS